MSRRKGYNWKARQVTDDNVEIDRSQEKKIKLDIPDAKSDQYDDCNSLVLPSVKRKTKVKNAQGPKAKLLTKKQRKNLEKIVERKKKEGLRDDLFRKLQSVQATEEVRAQLVSTSDMQSGNLKKHMETSCNDVLPSQERRSVFTGVGRKSRKIGPKKESEDDKDKEREYDTSDMSTDDSDVEAMDEEKTTETLPARPIPTDDKTESIPVKPVDVKADVKVDVKPVENKITVVPRKPAVNIVVERKEKIEKQRQELPVVKEEQMIVEAINENPVVIICGETGSGKTTQVPQFLYEAGYAHGNGIIGVTEPRRIAATCMAKRIATEMNLSSRKVSYQIRYEGNTTDDTKIKFMTDGVLLKEVQNDFELSRYSVIILDEAHERSIYTDILIGLLARIVPLREKRGNPLKLVIMSATLRVKDFTENPNLFRTVPPVIKIESRQFPVTVHWNRHTYEDYIGVAFKKVSLIHRTKPAGGILVFVTSQQEVHTLCAKLKRIFPFSRNQEANTNETSKISPKKEPVAKKEPKDLPPPINLDDFPALPMDEENEDDEYSNDGSDSEVLSDDPSDESDEESRSKIAAISTEPPMYVLPLYSLLSADKQAKVFEPPPEGCRFCVVATNVAETSLTIPGIKYVVDTGKVKTKFYDTVTGVSTFQVTWVSQAAANQRCGRAGRTGPGECYRLYSSACFQDFEEFSPPEITRRPVDDLVLQMRDIGIDRVVNFSFPTPPAEESLVAAEQLLYRLGALELSQESTNKSGRAKRGAKSKTYRLTSLGRTMAKLPVAPRYAKMLSLGHQHDLLPYVVAMVSALSVQEMFVETFSSTESLEEKEKQKEALLRFREFRRIWAGKGESLMLGDAMVLLKAVGAFECESDPTEFCDRNGLRYKAMVEARKLRRQLTNALNAAISSLNLTLDPHLSPPTDIQAKLLRQIVLSGLVDHIAKRLPDPRGVSAEEAKKMRNAYEDMLLVDPTFVHPCSVLYRTKHEYVVYQTIEESTDKKLFMKGITAIEKDWLPLLVPSEMQFMNTDPEKLDSAPWFDNQSGHVMCRNSGTFGPQFWEIPSVDMELNEGIGSFQWFGKFLLEGEVFPKLKPFSQFLLLPPATLIKTWAHIKPETVVLRRALLEKKVNNREALERVWSTDKTYLLKEYCMWLPESQHSTTAQIWPPQ